MTNTEILHSKFLGDRAIRCAFISLAKDRFEGGDDASLAAVLEKAGWSIEVVDWKNQSLDWNEFDFGVFRSPWDYHHQPTEFQAFLDRAAKSRCQFVNPIELVRFNFDKQYLITIAREFGFIIPTYLWRRDDHVDLISAVSESFSRFQTDELVVKPTVGAGSDKTFRLHRSQLLQMSELLRQASTDRDFLVQPFLPTIQDPGEFSLVFVNGAYYHTMLKRPRTGDFRVQSEHGGSYSRVEPERWLIEASQSLVNRYASHSKYARLDWVLNPDLESQYPFLLMEMELIEPDLYLRFTSFGIEQFASALVNHLASRER